MVNNAAKPRKRRKPLTNFSKSGLNQAGKTTVKDREGKLWKHVLTTDETEAKRLELFYKRAGRSNNVDYKIVRSGTRYDVFFRRE